MTILEPGTLCFLVGLVEMKKFFGRVVEVVAPAEEKNWYVVDAHWVREEFPGQVVLSPRAHLLPFTPPSTTEDVFSSSRAQ